MERWREDGEAVERKGDEEAAEGGGRMEWWRGCGGHKAPFPVRVTELCGGTEDGLEESARFVSCLSETVMDRFRRAAARQGGCSQKEKRKRLLS